MAFTDKYDKEDYYLSPDGFVIFTEKYHLKRGYCCESNCMHCPYKPSKKKKPDPENPEGGRDPAS